MNIFEEAKKRNISFRKIDKQRLSTYCSLSQLTKEIEQIAQQYNIHIDSIEIYIDFDGYGSGSLLAEFYRDKTEKELEQDIGLQEKFLSIREREEKEQYEYLKTKFEKKNV